MPPFYPSQVASHKGASMLNPEIKALLEFMNSQPQLPISQLTPQIMRAGTKAMTQSVEPVLKTVDMLVPLSAQDNEAGNSDPLPVRLYYPENPKKVDGATPAILFFHGGGFVLCDLDTHDNMCAVLCNASGSVVVSVDYRLAPEARFPAAPEDAYRALLWLHQEAQILGINGNAISVCGDSAGGNLAALLCLLTRDRHGPAIEKQLLIYPVISPKCDTPSQHNLKEGLFLNREQMLWFWQHYLGDNANAQTPYVDLLSANLNNLPPAVIITAQYDPLHDEGKLYADKLIAGGNTVKYTDVPGQIHGFCSFTDQVPQAKEVLHSLFET